MGARHLAVREVRAGVRGHSSRVLAGGESWQRGSLRSASRSQVVAVRVVRAGLRVNSGRVAVTTGGGRWGSEVVVAWAGQSLVRVRGTVVVRGRSRDRGRSRVPAGLRVPVRVPVVGGMVGGVVVVRMVRVVQGRVVAVRVRRAAGRIDSCRVLGGGLMLGLGGYHGGKGQNSDLQA